MDRKLDIQFILGISIVNALIVYKIGTKQNIEIRRFISCKIIRI